MVPRGTPSSVELSGQRDWTWLLGAITKDGDCLFSRFTESVIADHAKHFILALCEEFKGSLVVVPDGAPYFHASAVTDLTARDDLAFVTFPAYSPAPNPVEECWRQLQDALNNRFFDFLAELTTAIDTALDQLSFPINSHTWKHIKSCSRRLRYGSTALVRLAGQLLDHKM